MANNFTSDPNCVALFKLESAALTADSKGSNTLTDYNTVAANTLDYREGSGCADFELSNAEGLGRADADLSPDFPFKSASTNDTFSLCFWMKIESIPGNGYIVSKFDTTDNNRSFGLNIQSATNGLWFYFGYNSGASASSVRFGTATLQTGTWYHVAVTYDGATRYLRMRVWDDTAQALLSEDQYLQLANAVSIRAGDFYIGCRQNGTSRTYYFDGLIDEVVLFNDILSVTEIDAIRAGTYNSVSSISLSDSGQGADVLSHMAVALSMADSGAGADNFLSPAITLNIADAGTAADAIGFITALIQALDSANSLENLSFSTKLSVFDSGAGTDSATTHVLIRISDAGAGADLTFQIRGILALTDSGSAIDAISRIAALLLLSDSGAAIESIGVSHSGDFKTIFDAGTGSEAVGGITVQLAIADSAAALDLITRLTAALAIADAGEGMEAADIIQRLADIDDAGAGSDTLKGITVSAIVSDAATAADIVSQVLASLAVYDWAKGTDIETTITFLARGRLRITFASRACQFSLTGKAAEFSFSGKTPRFSCTGKGPKFSFSGKAPKITVH